MKKAIHTSCIFSDNMIKVIKKMSFISNHLDRFRGLLLLVLMVVVGGFLLAACSNANDGQLAEPAIILNPQSGGVNTQVNVHGENFPAGTAVMLRLGPPDVGATPFSYASGVVGGDGRFTLNFTVPESWPDGMPITETGLTVVVLNDDGSLKATAPFVFHPGIATELTSVVVDGVTTPNSILVSNEEGIVTAVRDYLTQTGDSTQVAIAVEKIEGEFARVDIISLDTDSEGKLIGFLKSVNDIWEILVIGRDFDSEQLLELGIPPSILPEEMLTPEG